MIIGLAMWLLLILPGYALLRWLSDERPPYGVLGVVALSYVGTFGLLSPVLIVGYVME